MEEFVAAAVIFAGIGLGNLWLILAGALMLFILAAIALLARSAGQSRKPRLSRSAKNPILAPLKDHAWESEAVFNPAALYHNGRVHLLYRALGSDGISRLGYASSDDGIHFERHPEPVYLPFVPTPEKYRNPFTSPARLQYDRALYASGGGWGGAEDPRMVEIDNRIHVTFNMFSGWDSMRVCLLSLPGEDFIKKEWRWMFNYLSAPGRHKNWVLFPEKIAGKYAVFHNLYHDDSDRVCVEYADEIEVEDHLPRFESIDPHRTPDRKVAWHHRTRSAGPPPLKTDHGWLLFYHAMDPDDPDRYKIGALLLDLHDPTKVLYRSSKPVLEPDEWYENDWKPGIVYSSGAVVKDGTLFLYYGGGDKTVNVATAPLERFLSELTQGRHAVVEKIK